MLLAVSRPYSGGADGRHTYLDPSLATAPRLQPPDITILLAVDNPHHTLAAQPYQPAKVLEEGDNGRVGSGIVDALARPADFRQSQARIPVLQHSKARQARQGASAAHPQLSPPSPPSINIRVSPSSLCLPLSRAPVSLCLPACAVSVLPCSICSPRQACPGL